MNLKIILQRERERGERSRKTTGLTALSLVLANWIQSILLLQDNPKHPPVTGQTKFEVFLSTFLGEPTTFVVVSKKIFFSMVSLDRLFILERDSTKNVGRLPFFRGDIYDFLRDFHFGLQKIDF